jgi:hypothetical protein
MMIDALEAGDTALLRCIITAHIQQSEAEAALEIQPSQRKSG